VVSGDGKRLAEDMETALHDEWNKMYAAVRRLAPERLHGHWRARRIFETFWAVVPWPQDMPYDVAYKLASSRIEARKTLRDFEGREEPNIKCSQCGKFEALQDHGTEYDWKKSREFWAQLAENGERYGSPFKHRFRSGERLCAVCTTCRLARRTVLKDDVPDTFESTSTIAARPFALWVKERAAGCERELAEFRAELTKVLTAAGVDLPAGDDAEFPGGIDGDWLYLETYDHTRLERQYGARTPAQSLLDSALGKLKNLRAKAGAKPSAYVALIKLDGDKVGDEIARRAGLPEGMQEHRKLSERLASTATPLRKIVEEQMHGRLIYAGGDDAVAITPAGSVVSGMQEMLKTMARELPKDMTVSAAVLILPHTDPLSGAIREVDRLLREVAKERLGRSHIVIAAKRQSWQKTYATIPWRTGDDERALQGFGKILEAIQAEQISPRFAGHFAEIARGFNHDEDTIERHERPQDVETMAAYWMGRAMKAGMPEQEQKDLFDALHDLIGAARGRRSIAGTLVDNLLTMRFLTRMEVAE